MTTEVGASPAQGGPIWKTLGIFFEKTTRHIDKLMSDSYRPRTSVYGIIGLICKKKKSEQMTLENCGNYTWHF